VRRRPSSRLGATPSARSSCALSPGPSPNGKGCGDNERAVLLPGETGKLPALLDKPLALPWEPTFRDQFAAITRGSEQNSDSHFANDVPA